MKALLGFSPQTLQFCCTSTRCSSDVQSQRESRGGKNGRLEAWRNTRAPYYHSHLCFKSLWLLLLCGSSSLDDGDPSQMWRVALDNIFPDVLEKVCVWPRLLESAVHTHSDKVTHIHTLLAGTRMHPVCAPNTWDVTQPGQMVRFWQAAWLLMRQVIIASRPPFISFRV